MSFPQPIVAAVTNGHQVVSLARVQPYGYETVASYGMDEAQVAEFAYISESYITCSDVSEIPGILRAPLPKKMHPLSIG